MAKRTELEWEVHNFPKENQFQKYVMDRLKKIKGVKAFNIAGTRFRSGIPDLLICANGQFVAIELKVQGYSATPLQVKELEAVGDAGGKAVICYNWGAVKSVLKECGVEF